MHQFINVVLALLSLTHAGHTTSELRISDIVVISDCASGPGSWCCEADSCCHASCEFRLSPGFASRALGCTSSQARVVIDMPCRDTQAPWEEELRGCEDYVMTFERSADKGDAFRDTVQVREKKEERLGQADWAERHGAGGLGNRDEIVGEWKIDSCAEAVKDGECSVSDGGCEVVECDGEGCVGSPGVGSGRGFRVKGLRGHAAKY